MKMIQKNLRGIIVFLLIIVMAFCLAGCKDKAKTKRPDMDTLRSAEVGSYIYFGEYEQDNNESTGKEAIEWLVLDKQEDRMLVISRYGLDCQPYHTEYEVITWETCSLRRWLNGEFYETAFIPEEKNVILTSVVTADANPEYDTPAGNDTRDQVFLLSIDEANRFFADDTSRTCVGTPYCYEQGTFKLEDTGTCWWWLRSPWSYSNYAPYVNYFGLIINGSFVYDHRGVVRPALWINLNP